MAARKTERVNVWLTPEQIAWLKSKDNASETMRALVTEAMNLDRLAASVKAGKTASKKRAEKPAEKFAKRPAKKK